MFSRQSKLTGFVLFTAACAFVLKAQAVNLDTEEKIKDTPSFLQRQSSLNFTDDGKEYCGPVAVSNILMYLGKHGFPKLVPAAKTDFEAQTIMIKRLASSDFMKTTDHSGTGLISLLKGLQYYAEDCGYPLKTIRYMGIARCPLKYSAGDMPDLDWIAEESKKDCGECLTIGWYKYDELTNTYTRAGGHWVTVVGYKKKSPAKDDLILIVKNPASGKTEELWFECITSGALLRPRKNRQAGFRPRSAEGFYKIVKGLSSQTHKVPIVEGALVFYL